MSEITTNEESVRFSNNSYFVKVFSLQFGWLSINTTYDLERNANAPWNPTLQNFVFGALDHIIPTGAIFFSHPQTVD
ncbi:unnamed protein product [Hermetia illucens]|uniref:Uncharacterized protein n=1 Tax=Hermetia illucens TaxID=343691 RepID=A0A7R8UIX1_HERIL|nr:unnamed protein product [Hermetia illucens]